MSIFEHSRWAIFNASQHPYKHPLSDFQYGNPAFGGEVTNLQQALDWILAVLYPNTKDAVATPADLPASGNTLNDFRVVNDDGDGKPAGYRWEQREGEASASWHKIYDWDWSSDSIIAAYLDKTQDMYVYKWGRDDRDGDGNVITGVLAGQSVYGGASASTHLTLFANAGDGTGPNTGYVQFGDNVRPTTDASFDLGTLSEQFKDLYLSGTSHVGTLALSGGSITDSAGTIDFDDENLQTSGSVSAGTLLLASGSITDSSGAIDFGSANLTTSGSVTAGGGFFGTVTVTDGTFGTLTVSSGSITDTSGAISFDDENLSTTGSITSGQLSADNLRLSGNTLSSTDTDGDIILAANGAGVVDVQSPLTTLGQTITGTVSVTGQLNVDFIRIDGTVISSIATDGSIDLQPSGTGILSTSARFLPTSDGTLDLGAATNRWNDLYLDGSIGDGTNSITVASLLALRDIDSSVSTGDSIFWDGSKWVASAPDTEIDHSTISGLTTGDSGHTQFAMLAGRSGGQTIQGGTGASENLTLESTSNATKGSILFASTAKPSADNSFDLGGSGASFKDLYLKGQAKGLRLENFTTAGRPSASASTPGRAIWDTDLSDLLVDIGGSWLKMSQDKIVVTDTAGWDGSATSVAYTIDGSGSASGVTYVGRVSDAREAVWALKDNSNTFEQIFAKVTCTQTQVTVTVSAGLPAGTYTLIGVG